MIGSITPAGVLVTEKAVSTSFELASGITVGPDGTLWFTDFGGNEIGRITPAGMITWFDMPSSARFPTDITAGPDGDLWFTLNSGQIGRMTVQGAFTLFALPLWQDQFGRMNKEIPWAITMGPDGNLWFSGVQGIGRITPKGSITEISTPPLGSGIELTAGPDDAIWFTDPPDNWIGRIRLGG